MAWTYILYQSRAAPPWFLSGSFSSFLPGLKNREKTLLGEPPVRVRTTPAVAPPKMLPPLVRKNIKMARREKSRYSAALGKVDPNLKKKKLLLKILFDNSAFAFCCVMYQCRGSYNFLFFIDIYKLCTIPFALVVGRARCIHQKETWFLSCSGCKRVK